jgi:carbon-monoxide dehydrogenase medium subunit
MKAAAFDYHRARDLGDALAALSAHDGEAKILAGGCSLGPMLNLRLARPSALIDLAGAVELRQLAERPKSLLVGAGWTHAEIEDGVVPDVTRGFMRKVASGIAYRPIRNRGTLGGSLAHADPAADWVTAMVVLDATLHIRGKQGERRQPAAAFMRSAYTTDLADGEIIVAVEVPILSDRARWSYHKICRKTGEFALAIGAAIVDPERHYARVVCGAVEAPPLILPQASAALVHNAPDPRRQVGAEADSLLAGRDPAFRQLHRVAVERAIAELVS